MSRRSKQKAGPQEPRAAQSDNRAADVRDRWAAAGVCLFLVGIIWVVFGQTAHFEFVNYDDNGNVYQNPVVQKGWSAGAVGWAFTHAQISNWIPLTTLSHILDCQLFGLWAGGHHLVNVLLHTVTTVLLFLLLRRMTGAIWRSAFVAAVFAIHPLRAESVAWVSERKDVLSGVFFMLTLWAYLRYTEEKTQNNQGLHGLHGWKAANLNPDLNPNPKPTLSMTSVVRSRASAFFYVVALVFFALGLLAKSMVATLPFVLLLLDYWPLGRMQEKAESRKQKLDKAVLPGRRSGGWCGRRFRCSRWGRERAWRRAWCRDCWWQRKSPGCRSWNGSPTRWFLMGCICGR